MRITSLMMVMSVAFVSILPNKVVATSVSDQLSRVETALASAGAINADQVLVQTFTVGVEGLLTQIDFQVYQENTPTSDLTLSLLGTSNGVPQLDQFLGSVAISPNRVPMSTFGNPPYPFVPVDVSGLRIEVSPGDVIAIELTYTDVSGQYSWYSEGTLYPGGNLGLRHPSEDPSATMFFPTDDHGFTTWVEPVPEPASASIAAVGLVCGALGLRVRR